MAKRTLSVSELNEYVKGVFEDELVLHNLNVCGEIYEFKQAGGNTFITLRDSNCILNCVSFSLTETFSAGDSVVLYGSVKYYEKNGKVSFVFSTITRKGKGNLLADFNALRDKLQAEGYFDRKKPIAAPLRRVAVITSETGAVIHDFIQTVNRNRKFTDIYLYPATVQGKLAAKDLITKLSEASTVNYDLIVLARGGGSSDDLSVFNDENLVKAVADCAIPVISAVGHETDFTLCDFAASVRAGTPSMAGEYIARKNEEFFLRLENTIAAIDSGISVALARKVACLSDIAQSISYKSEVKSERIRTKIANYAVAMSNNLSTRYLQLTDKIVRIADIMSEKVGKNYDNVQLAVERLTARLDINNPLRILSRGYAKLYKRNGDTLRYSDVAVGEEINAVLSDGKLTAKITAKSKIGVSEK